MRTELATVSSYVRHSRVPSRHHTKAGRAVGMSHVSLVASGHCPPHLSCTPWEVLHANPLPQSQSPASRALTAPKGVAFDPFACG